MNNTTTPRPQRSVEVEADFIGLLESHCKQNGAVKPLSNTFLDRIERLKSKAEVSSVSATDAISPPLRMESLSNNKKKEFQQKMDLLREMHKQRKSNLPKLINPVPNPSYDEVYHDGVTWLESLSGE